MSRQLIGLLDNNAGTTAKVIQRSPNASAFLRALSLRSTQTGQLTKLDVSGAPLINSDKACPLSIFAPDSQVWEANAIDYPMLTGQAMLDVQATLDVAGTLGGHVLIDELGDWPTIAARVDELQRAGAPASFYADPNFLVGLGSSAIAASGTAQLTCTTKRPMRGMYRFVLDVIGAANAVEDIQLTSMDIAGVNQLGSGNEVPAISLLANNSAKLGGLFRLDLPAASIITANFRNDDAVNAGTIRGCFIRYRGSV